MMEHRARILFVEDDVAKRYVVAKNLRAAGFDVDEAETGQQGLDKIRSDHDVAILDLKLPDISGLEVSKRIKENPSTSRVMVLALSAQLTSPTDRAAGLDLGADAYLVHPIETIELVATVNALVRLKRAIDTRDVQRELFIAMIGHDLRNPLMMLTTGLMLLKESEGLSDEDRALLQKFDRSCARMKQLIDQLLLLTQTLSGKESIERHDVDLAGVSNQLVDDLDGSKGRVALEISGPVHASGDATSLTQLVDNLISNALKHGQGTVAVRLFEENGFACIAVHNRGTPIPDSARARLFDPFKEDSRRAGGYGLGLFIVDRIVQAHHGSIEVTSTAEAGTTFLVRLPK